LSTKFDVITWAVTTDTVIYFVKSIKTLCHVSVCLRVNFNVIYLWKRIHKRQKDRGWQTDWYTML